MMNPENDYVSMTETTRKIEVVGEMDYSNPLPPPIPSNDAFQGKTGVFKYIAKDTEADSMAMLVTFLVAFGNMVGRNAYYEVEATRHYPNLFAVIVGASSKARKGTSWAISKKILSLIDEQWTKQNIKSGLASGEGLKYAVRDAVKKLNKNGEEIIADNGIEDKRILIIETEFAATLTVANRTGNTLSTTIRDAWDSGDLCTLTKNDPIVSTNSHISVLAHITNYEILKMMSGVDAANGYANRFLWVYVKRGKLLPFGGQIDWESIRDLKLEDSVLFGLEERSITMDYDAKEEWRKIYEELSIERYGLLGSISSRAEAQVIRLSLIYAILDCSPYIKAEHLRAAVAVWNYCAESIEYIFGDKFGDRTANVIYTKLLECKKLSATEIHKLFANNISKSDIDQAISGLLKFNKIRKYQEKSGGRPTTFFLINESN